MADTLGASYLVFNPGDLGIMFAYQQVNHVSHTSADNADAAIVISAPAAGNVHILLIHATYEAAADAGNLNVTGAVASISDQSPVIALTAGATKITQLPNPLTFKNAAGAVTVTLKAGGSLTGTVSVWYVYDGAGFGGS